MGRCYLILHIQNNSFSPRFGASNIARFSGKTMNIESENDYFSKTFNGLSVNGNTFSEIEMEDCLFQNCNLSDAVFRKCKFIDCTFIQCNLSNINIAYSKFSDVTFDQCKLIGVDWTKADWPRLAFSSPLKFTQCTMNDSSFFGLRMDDMILEYSKAQDVDFRNGSFVNAKFIYTDLANSLFAKSNLKDADFQEATNYNINIFENIITGAKFTRDEAVRLLYSLDIELFD